MQRFDVVIVRGHVQRRRAEVSFFGVEVGASRDHRPHDVRESMFA